MKNEEITSWCIIDERIQKIFSNTFSVNKKTKSRFIKETRRANSVIYVFDTVLSNFKLCKENSQK